LRSRGGNKYFLMAGLSLSLEAIDIARLGEQLGIVRDSGIRMVHIDVTDGHFAPDVAFGIPIVDSIRRATDFALDLHVLVERPDRFVADLIRIGPSRVAVHAEPPADVLSLLRIIRSQGMEAGVALLPGTPVEALNEVGPEMDFLNVLSADPRAQEETYIPRTTSKVRRAVELRARCGASFAVQVEGGIDKEQVFELLAAGADQIVAGKAAFRQPDPRSCLREFIRRVSDGDERGENHGAPPTS
jgi:ribulose-phosphate 3-epimerase